MRICWRGSPRGLPFGDGRRLIERVLALAHLHARQGGDYALAHGPGFKRGGGLDAGHVALANDAALVGHHEGRGVGVRQRECRIHRLGRATRVVA